MQFSFSNNGFPVEATYSEAFIGDIALPLLKEWTRMQREKGTRLVVFLAAPPAAGKSTLSAFLEKLSKDTPGVTPLTACGMDGFHHYQEYLKTHTMLRDGQAVPMVAYKGAPETFDVQALSSRLARLNTDGACPWPVYSRVLHNPVEGELTVTGDIVLVEGNYLLLDWPQWRDLRRFADDTVFLTAEPGLLRERLLARKLLTVQDPVAAADFVDRSDLYNARTILKDSYGQRVTLVLCEDGELRRGNEE